MSSSFKDKIAEINDGLDKYAKENNILANIKMEEPDCLKMSISDIRKQPTENITDMMYDLSRYAMYINRKINRNRAFQKWAETQLDECTATNLPKIGDGFGWNERMLIARNTPEVCQTLNKFLSELKMRIEDLRGVPEDINRLVDILNNIRFERNKEREY